MNTITTSDIHRLTAFSTVPSGGNPAGVWVGESLPTDDDMLALAAEIGYSETVFAAMPPGVSKDTGATAEGVGAKATVTGDIETRYFSPLAEVPFCGHATIALGVHLGRTRGAGTYRLATRAGEIPVTVEKTAAHETTAAHEKTAAHGRATAHDEAVEQWTATLTSVEPSSTLVIDDDDAISVLRAVLDALHWESSVLDADYPPAIAYAGARHLILTLRDRATLAEAAYDFEPMKAIMAQHDLTTIDLVWMEPGNSSKSTTTTTVHSRNLFAVGGVVEDPATGAAAAAFVGHLRTSRRIQTPHRVTIHQGHDMGRPSLLNVLAPPTGGIEVSGTAVPLDDA